MKKNAIGHMMAKKEPMGKRIRRLGILPMIVCLLVAFVLWLAVYDINHDKSDTPNTAGQDAAVQAVE